MASEETENLSQQLSGEEGIEQRLISLREAFEIAECLHPFLEPYSGEEREREMEERIHAALQRAAAEMTGDQFEEQLRRILEAKMGEISDQWGFLWSQTEDGIAGKIESSVELDPNWFGAGWQRRLGIEVVNEEVNPQLKRIRVKTSDEASEMLAKRIGFLSHERGPETFAGLANKLAKTSYAYGHLSVLASSGDFPWKTGGEGEAE